MSRPVAYLRRSNPNRKNGQHRAGLVSHEMQEQAVHELAQRHGFTLTDADILTDWGISGRAHAVGQRKAYQELMERVKSGQASAIFAYSLSRLGRSVTTIREMADACREAGVPIHLAKEGTLDNGTYGKMVYTILAAVAEMEAELASERGLDRTAVMRDNGRFVGRPPFGWVHGADGKLVVDAEAAAIARRARDLYRRHLNYDEVARILNDDAVPTPTMLRLRREDPPRDLKPGDRGRLWRSGTIIRIVARGTTPEPIRRDRTRKGSRGIAAAPFVRLLRCADCGAMLTTKITRYRLADGSQKVWRGYDCQGNQSIRNHTKPSIIGEKVVMEWARAEVAKLSIPYDQVEMSTAAEVDALALSERRGRLLDAVEDGLLSRDEIKARLDAIAAEEEALRTRSEIVELPEIDWLWPPDKLAPVLAALWKEIEVDIPNRAFRPDPRVPEWWAA